MRIRAGESDREMIAALGVDIRSLFTLVFALGAMRACVAGALVGALLSVDLGLGVPVLFLAFVGVVFGDRPLYLDVPAVLGGAVPLPGGGGYPAYRLAIIGVGLAMAAGLYLLIAKTRLGMQIRAGESDREMIGALGVDIRTLYTAVFALGAALAGLAGGLVGALQSVQVGMGEPVLILAFVVIIIGGIGSVKGALVAAILVGVTDTLGRVFLPQLFGLFLPPSEATSVGSSLAAMAIYLLMAGVLAFRPKGLFPVDA
jgi:branched-chain amino acid transport system permease protein